VSLPTDAQERKELPVWSGFINYFPDAIAEVAELSRIGNDQHNPGKPLFWDRSKSGDELDALMRHLIEAGTVDTDGVRHSTKVAWRAMANLQKELERATNSPAIPELADERYIVDRRYVPIEEESGYVIIDTEDDERIVDSWIGVERMQGAPAAKRHAQDEADRLNQA
jgi:hypothetical protein